jgi:hypothetical protein
MANGLWVPLSNKASSTRFLQGYEARYSPALLLYSIYKTDYSSDPCGIFSFLPAHEITRAKHIEPTIKVQVFFLSKVLGC